VVPQWYSRSHRVIYWDTIARPAITPPLSLGMIDSWWTKAAESGK
jgi:ABC-type oligopeptide transport system substrate-binding subunit